MAVLVPGVFGRRLSSEAEYKLAERFAAQTSDGTVLLHSVGLIRHKKKRWAEADFVLIDAAGIFCLEVKGGRVGRTDGVWNFTDRHGHTNTKYEGPFDQAGGVAGALQAWLADTEILRDDGTRFQVGYGVMTPDCTLNVTGPDIDSVILYDERDGGSSLAGFVARLGAYWQQRFSENGLSEDEITRLQTAIRPDFEARITRSLVVAHVEDELLRFTEEQELVLEGLTDNERLITRGAAGTGKSLLAVHEARRLAGLGRSVLLVCHTRSLADALGSACGDEVSVTTAASLMTNVVERAGLTSRLPDATDDAIFDMFLPELAVEALAADPSLAGYEALVIDEGQDLLSTDVADALDLAFRGGFAQGVWRVFQDPNQNIFGKPRPKSLELLDSGHPTSLRLKENCRNTMQIVDFSKILSGAAIVAPSRTSGPDVRVCVRWDDAWEERTVTLVEGFISEGVPPEDIAVLTHTRSQLEAIMARDPQLFVARGRRGHVHCSTIAAFKGLDATAVVLAGLASLDKPHHRQAAYVGATRARVLLGIALSSSAKRSYDNRLTDYAMQIAADAQEQAERDDLR